MLKKKKRLIFLSIPYFLAHFSVFQDLSSRVFFLLLIHPNVFEVDGLVWEVQYRDGEMIQATQ